MSAADSKRKMCGCSIVQQLFVFYQQNNKRPKQVPSLDFEMYQFFFLPQIFFPFPKFVICWLHIGERKPFVSKQLFWWRSKNHNKTPPTQKKNDLVKCKVFPSNKSGLVKCNVFCHTKKFLFFFFFFHAGFVWMIELVKKKCFVLSTRFPLSKTALFLPKLHSVLKKGLKAKVVSVFCVKEPFNRL